MFLDNKIPMNDKQVFAIRYPQKPLIRRVLRVFLRYLCRIIFRVNINGRENFPDGGPLLVVGNHDAMIEAVLMAVFTPWQIEFLGHNDFPQEAITEIAHKLYGVISITRGKVDREALRKCLDLLKQGGILGIFPEGGIFREGAMRARTGVAWLSYRSKTPVLPIGFGGTHGALNEALRFKRPQISINVGTMIPAAEVPEEKSLKPYLQDFANQIMTSIDQLRPENSLSSIKDESFDLEIILKNCDGDVVSVPQDLRIKHGGSLSKFLHSPRILKIFRINLKLKIHALQNLHLQPGPSEILSATDIIINSIEEKLPYFLIYCFGPKEAEIIKNSLNECLELAEWAKINNLQIQIKPIRRYHSSRLNRDITQVKQDSFERWM
jgi:1-acyl-sn-glycerol-3-phosphate acyltransferase